MYQILGINALSHDTSAVLIRDGKIIAAVEEERFNRKKHSYGIVNGGQPPSFSIDWIMRSFEIDPLEINAFAYCGYLEGNLFKKINEKYYSFANSLDPGLKKSHFYNHHMCHAASSFLCSGFDDALIITADGYGGGFSTVVYEGRGKTIKPIATFPVNDSLGVFYSAITELINLSGGGFGQGRTMAISSFAKKKFVLVPELIIRNTFGYVFDLEKFLEMKKNSIDYNEEFQKAAGIAAWAQEELEKTIIHLIELGFENTCSRNLCLAGGIFQNCKLNEVIAQTFPTKNIYIPAAANDSGTSLGAALLASTKVAGYKNCSLNTAALGPAIRQVDLMAILKKSDLNYKWVKNPAKIAAELIASGKVIGWMQGRMEFGPRSLGQRSMFADPRRLISAKKLSKIKKREEWRPFAPVVKEDKVGEWFVHGKKNLFMTTMDYIKKEKRKIIPAVVHVDGSARLQTVGKSHILYKLIDEFEKITGIPIIINTSLNCQEPIVMQPKEALSLLVRSDLDVMIIGNWIIVE